MNVLAIQFAIFVVLSNPALETKIPAFRIRAWLACRKNGASSLKSGDALCENGQHKSENSDRHMVLAILPIIIIIIDLFIYYL